MFGPEQRLHCFEQITGEQAPVESITKFALHLQALAGPRVESALQEVQVRLFAKQVRQEASQGRQVPEGVV